MFVSEFVRRTKAAAFLIALGVSAASGTSAQAAQLPCGHPDTPPTASVQVRIEAWKEPLLVEEFKKFGRQRDYIYFDGPYYVPVAGKPERPKVFKYWQIQKSFESKTHFIALDLSNAPGDGVYTLQIRQCATSQAWEPIWKEWMQIVDTKVVARGK
jgi:hypothetical protein